MSIQAWFYQWACRLVKFYYMRQSDESLIPALRRTTNTGSFSSIPNGCLVNKKTIAGVSCEWITPEHHTGDVIIYFHGGAFMAGHCDSHRDMACRLAEACKAELVLVDYRLAPEHTFPAAHDDAFCVYTAVANQLDEKQKIIIAGDSSGGNLVIATAVKARDEGIKTAKALLCFSPWLDMTLSGNSCQANQKIDPLLPINLANVAVKAYAAGHDVNDFRLSPLFSNTAGLPPTYINVSDVELLLSDAEAFAKKCEETSVQIQLSIWKNMPHAFPTAAKFVPEGRQAINEAAEFLAAI